jgi:hypothetical protein
MPVESAMSVTVCSALKAALLLTGNAASAESAVLQAISSLDPQKLTAESLLHSTIELATRGDANCDRSDLGVGWPGLPVELRNVLAMKTTLRQCFVLRVLLGLPEERCAWLLQLSRDEVGAKACVAGNEKTKQSCIHEWD